MLFEYLFPSYSFGIETIKRSYASVVPSETIPDSRKKIGKVYTRFQTKTAQKPHPWGWHIPIMDYIRFYPPPPPTSLPPPKTSNNYLNGSYSNRLWKHNGFRRVNRKKKKKKSLRETDSIHVRKALKLWLKMISASAWKSSVSSLIMVKNNYSKVFLLSFSPNHFAMERDVILNLT